MVEKGVVAMDPGRLLPIEFTRQNRASLGNWFHSIKPPGHPYEAVGDLRDWFIGLQYEGYYVLLGNGGFREGVYYVQNSVWKYVGGHWHMCTLAELINDLFDYKNRKCRIEDFKYFGPVFDPACPEDKFSGFYSLLDEPAHDLVQIDNVFDWLKDDG